MKKITALLIALLLAVGTFAQNVGINSAGSAPNSSAMLDVKSLTKGLPDRERVISYPQNFFHYLICTIFLRACPPDTS